MNTQNTSVMRSERQDAESCVDFARVFNSAMGSVLSSKEIDRLNPQAIGSCAVLLKHLCSQPGKATPIYMEQGHARTVMLMRGVPAAEIEFTLDALEMAGLLSKSADSLTFPVLNSAMDREIELLSNRKAGWSKRTGRMPAEPNIKPEANSAPVPKKASVKKVRKEAGVKVARFGATDADDTSESEIVMRIQCLSGSIAEITPEYVAYMGQNYRHTDAMQQFSQIRLWCESNEKKRKTLSHFRRFVNTWMNNANTQGQIRSQIMRAKANGNGFGQGSLLGIDAHGPLAATESNSDAATGIEDDFVDMFAASVDDQPAATPSIEPALEVIISAPIEVIQPQERAMSTGLRAILAARGSLAGRRISASRNTFSGASRGCQSQ